MEFAADGERTARMLVQVLRLPPGAKLPRAEVAEKLDVGRLEATPAVGLVGEASAGRAPRFSFERRARGSGTRSAILVILAITAVQSALIATLVLERRKRIRAQRSVQEQAAFEQMLAALEDGPVRHAPDDASQALEQAVARIARLTGAESAGFAFMRRMRIPALGDDPLVSARS